MIKDDKARKGLCFLFDSTRLLVQLLAILIYRDRSIDPVVEYYIYELFAVVTGMIFFYRLAGYEFGSRKPRLSVFFGIIAVYLGFVTALGPL